MKVEAVRRISRRTWHERVCLGQVLKTIFTLATPLVSPWQSRWAMVRIVSEQRQRGDSTVSSRSAMMSQRSFLDKILKKTINKSLHLACFTRCHWFTRNEEKWRPVYKVNTGLNRCTQLHTHLVKSQCPARPRHTPGGQGWSARDQQGDDDMEQRGR